MKRERALSWTAFLAWAALLFALQAALGRGVWFPELGLVFLLSLVARMEAADALPAAALAALARAALGGEPPLVVLGALLLFVFAALVLRSVVELTPPLWRFGSAALCVLACELWLALVHEARLASAGSAADFALPLGSLLAAALSSGLAALVLGPALAHLPGLTPLRSRRW